MLKPTVEGWVGIFQADEIEEGILVQRNSICSMWRCGPVGFAQASLGSGVKMLFPTHGQSHNYKVLIQVFSYWSFLFPTFHLLQTVPIFKTLLKGWLLHETISWARVTVSADTGSFLCSCGVLTISLTVLAMSVSTWVSSRAPWTPWQQRLCLMHLHSPVPRAVPGIQLIPICSWGMEWMDESWEVGRANTIILIHEWRKCRWRRVRVLGPWSSRLD